uniref:SOCS box domain-containing protein n=1 Tax=Macrostomum lignano TaxID=282301 RepID=A0A1I8FLL9_9PLAT
STGGTERLLGAVHEWRPLFLLAPAPRPDPARQAIDAHARLADRRLFRSRNGRCPAICWPTISRTYPLLKRCLRQGVYEAAAVLDLLPTCPDPRAGRRSVADSRSPLLTYSLQCLFSMPECAEQHATRLVQLAPERLTPASCTWLATWYPSLLALAILSSSAFQTDWLPICWPDAASLRFDRFMLHDF